jgi:hypothetical protein
MSMWDIVSPVGTKSIPHKRVTKSSSSGLREFKDGKEEDKVPVSARLVQLTISGDEENPTAGSFTLSRTNGH